MSDNPEYLMVPDWSTPPIILPPGWRVLFVRNGLDIVVPAVAIVKCVEHFGFVKTRRWLQFPDDERQTIEWVPAWFEDSWLVTTYNAMEAGGFMCMIGPGEEVPK